MSSVNEVHMIGNLGSDPEVRSTSSGTQVANLSVATHRRWTDGDGAEQERTEWHKIVCWDQAAEFADGHLSKGDQIYVRGRLQYRKWEDDDGLKRTSTEIVARRLVGLSPNRNRGREDAPRSAPEPADDIPEETLTGGEDDLPF